MKRLYYSSIIFFILALSAACSQEKDEKEQDEDNSSSNSDGDSDSDSDGDSDSDSDGDSDSDTDGDTDTDTDGDSDSDTDGDSDSDTDGDSDSYNDQETDHETETNPDNDKGLLWLHVDGNEIQDPSGNEVILRGISLIDLSSLESWDGGIKVMIDRLTDQTDTQGDSPGWYPKVLRLPVYSVDSEVKSPLRYEHGSDEYYDKLLRPAVDYCRKKGLYAIIDWHAIDDTTDYVENTSEFWRDMAPKFAEDSHVLFELYNEPINNGDWSSELKQHMQTWYDIVRESAPDNLVLVGTPNWSQNVGKAATDPIEGSNVVYTVHMYPMHWQSQGLRDELTTAKAVAPVFMSEWGFEENSDQVVDGTISSYGQPFKEFVNQNGLSWTAWVAHYLWFPAMYEDKKWTLAVGEGRMGGFTKDWLYEERNNDLPTGE